MRLKHLSYLSILFGAAFLLFSCSVGYVSLSVLQPAEISLPADIRNVAVYNNSCETDPPGSFSRITQMRLDERKSYSDIKFSYLKGLYKTISLSPRFTQIYLADSACNYAFSADSINWTLIDSLCRINQAQAIILLESGDSYDDLDIYSFFSYCYVNYKVINEHKWSVYYPSSRQRFSFQLSDTLRWEGQDENCYFDSPDMYDLLSEACENSGIRAGIHLAPYWENNVPRVIFTGSNRSLKKAAGLVNSDSWYEAAIIWNKLAESANKKIAAKAAFNIALAYERDDNLPQSLLWIDFADSVAGNKYIKSYKNILLERAEINELLNSQMGVE